LCGLVQLDRIKKGSATHFLSENQKEKGVGVDEDELVAFRDEERRRTRAA